MTHITGEQANELREQGYSWREIGEQANEPAESIRTRAKKAHNYKPDLRQAGRHEPDAKVQQTFNQDGSITSSLKLRRMNDIPNKPEDFLAIHGFDSKTFRVKQVLSNTWEMTNGDGDKYENYQSKIIAEPITKAELTHEDMIAMIRDIKPITVKPIVTDQLENFLLIPIYDIHFGHNSLNDMQPLLNSICEQVQMGYEEIVVVLGGDIQHTDNFLNTTEHGTQIDTVDARQAFQDASKFLTTLLTECAACSNSVSCVYLPGNHAPSNDWFLVQLLKEKLPQVYFDDEYDDYKQVWLGNHSIFLHHGDKIKSTTRLLEVMVSKFGKEWGESVSRYFITGHFHHEKTLSVAGMTHYQVMSP